MKISDLLRRAVSCTRGNVVIVFGITAPVLLLAGGGAVDYASRVTIKSNLQAVADGAALAGAREIALANAKSKQIKDVAITHAKSSLGSTAKGSRTRIRAKVIDDFTGVRVQIKKSWKSVFGRLLGEKHAKVSVEATAHISSSTKICVLGLMEGSALAAVHLDNSARLTAEDCGVYSNSKSVASIRTDNASELSAQLICSAGGTLSASSASFTPEPITDCPQVPDPLSERKAPPIDGCTENHLVVDTDTILSPGTYCGGLRIRGTARVDLQPGRYVIRNGPLLVEDQASFDGMYVSFQMEGLGSTFNFRENTEISLGAPKEGPMAGLLFYETPKPKLMKAIKLLADAQSEVDDVGAALRLHRINSNKARQLLGTIYLPNSILQIDANAPVADKSAYTAIVVRRLWLKEGPHLILNSDYGATDVPIPSSLVGANVKLTR